MTEQELMDRWLREAMAGAEPRLSSRFDATLSRRLRARRLSPTGRLLMALYVVAAVLVSVSTMRSVWMEWPHIAAAILAPLMILAALYGRRLVGTA